MKGLGRRVKERLGVTTVELVRELRREDFGGALIFALIDTNIFLCLAFQDLRWEYCGD